MDQLALKLLVVSQVLKPSIHVCSKFRPSTPHLLNQEAPSVQQVAIPSLSVAHLGQGVSVVVVVGVGVVVVVVAATRIVIIVVTAVSAASIHLTKSQVSV